MLKRSKKHGYKIQTYTQKNGDISYFIVYKANGRLIYKKVGSKKEGMSEKKAFEIRSKILNNIRNGNINNATFYDEIAQHYFYAISHKKSCYFYKKMYDKHLKESIGKLKIKHINDTALDKLMAEKKDNGLSPATIKQIISLANRIATFALKRGYTEKALFRDIRYPKFNNERSRYLSKKEITKLLNAVKDNISLSLFVEIALQTGARANSILVLQKKDISFENYYIKMQDFKSNKEYIAFLKEETFTKIKKLTHDKSQNFYIVANKYKPLTYAQLYKKLHPILDKLFNKNIKDSTQKVVIHTLRHTFASHLAINGVPLQEIKKLMNHSDVKMTLKYAKLMPGSGREFVEGLY